MLRVPLSVIQSKSGPKDLPCKTPSARGQFTFGLMKPSPTCLPSSSHPVASCFHYLISLWCRLIHVFGMEQGIRHVSCVYTTMQRVRVQKSVVNFFFVISPAAPIGTTTRCLDASSWHWHFIDNRRPMSLLAFSHPLFSTLFLP